MKQLNTTWSMPEVRLPMYAGEGAVLMRDWTVCVRGHWFTVPAGTSTDGASIPRALWRVCGHPLAYPRVYAALLHDWLYGGGGRDECPTRGDADAVYRDLLIDLGWGKIKAYIVYAALRIFGGSHRTAVQKRKGVNYEENHDCGRDDRGMCRMHVQHAHRVGWTNSVARSRWTDYDCQRRTGVRVRKEHL